VDYLKGILELDGVEITVHMILRNRERTVAVFPSEVRLQRGPAIGGDENRSYERVRADLLVRWGRDGDRAEAKAWEAYRALAQRQEDFGFIRCLHGAPVWMGMDERGVYEYLVDFEIYVMKEERD